jgi:hypothetical protein
MKKLLTTLALVLTLGCQDQEVPLPDGWAEAAASNWAIDLGENSPRVSCLADHVVGRVSYAACSVRAFGVIHKLQYQYPDKKCAEELPR